MVQSDPLSGRSEIERPPTLAVQNSSSHCIAEEHHTSDAEQDRKLLSPNERYAHFHRDATITQWPYSLKSYCPSIYHGDAAAEELRFFERKYLSKETDVKAIICRPHQLGRLDLLDESKLEALHSEASSDTTKIFFVGRFLIKKGVTDLPRDVKRLRISSSAFRKLLLRYECPPLLVSCLVTHDLPLGPCGRQSLRLRDRVCSDFWYTVPVRAAIPCTEDEKSHALSAAGSNQMDPSQYLHLNDCAVDIRPAKIVMYSHYDHKTRNTSIICVDFQDGRWPELAEEPYLRVKEAVESKSVAQSVGSHYMHLTILTSTTKWWRMALERFNNQLIEHEKTLLRGRYNLGRDDATGDMHINSHLHTMAAHLHRYKAEILILNETVSELSKHLRSFGWSALSEMNACSPSAENDHFSSALPVVRSGINAICNLIEELEIKVDTVIALSFNQNKVAMDKQIVASNESMRKILKATQAETRHSRYMAKQSQEMATEMRKDSLSMKTIALLTMLFLPGTSFAAVLSMPFFAQQSWMSNTTRIWVWVALTVPSTALAVIWYTMHTRKEMKRSKRSDIPLEDLNGLGIDNNA